MPVEVIAYINMHCCSIGFTLQSEYTIQNPQDIIDAVRQEIMDHYGPNVTPAEWFWNILPNEKN